MPGSYARLSRRWQPGDRVELDLPMEPIAYEAHPLVEETRNHVAMMRGPLVYCLESVDLPKRVSIDDVRLPRDARWKVRHDRDLLGGVTVLETEGVGVMERTVYPAQALYRPASGGPTRLVALRLIPYYAWCNRGPSQMTVWIPLY